MPQEPLPESREIISRFEKQLAELARSGVDFAVVGGLAIILKTPSWREKDQLDAAAMREIIER